MVSFGLDPAKAPAPVRASKEPIIRLFSWHDAHPIALFMVLLKRFGADFLEWDPHALRKEIVSSFEATSVSELNWNKIEAARTAVLVSSPWSEWHVFEKVVQGLNNNEVDPEVGQPASLPQLMAGVDILSGLDSDMKFSKEVAAYVAACALEAGVIYLPPPLDFAQTMLSEPQYYCRDCKSVGDDILDGRCDNCVGRFKHWDQKISDRPAPGTSDSAGRNVERFVRRDPLQVRQLFEKWKSKPPSEINDEDVVEVQTAKLLVAHNYMTLRQSQLKEQLVALKDWVEK